MTTTPHTFLDDVWIEYPKISLFKLPEEISTGISIIQTDLSCSLEKAQHEFFAIMKEQVDFNADLLSQFKAAHPGYEVYYFVDPVHNGPIFHATSYENFFKLPVIEFDDMESYGKFYVTKNCKRTTAEVILQVPCPKGENDDREFELPIAHIDAYGFTHGCSDMIETFWFDTEEERDEVKRRYANWIEPKNPKYASMIRATL